MRRTPPRILLALTGLGLDGGIAVVNRCILRALATEVEAGRVAGVDCVLLHDGDASAADPSLGSVSLARGSYPRFVWEAWRRIALRRPELVFFDHVGVAQTMGLPLPGLARPFFTLFVHYCELDAASSGMRARGLRRADRILVNSSFTAQVVRRAAPEQADRVVTTELCVDPDKVDAWEAADQETVEREPLVLIVGRMLSEEPGKGHDAVIEAFPAVLQQVPAARFVIVGAGDDLSRLKGKAEGLGLGTAVEFAGRVSDQELRRLYQRASVLAMPSQQEGFGLVYVEAMWQGLACIGSTADAAGSVIVDGETGLLVPYADPPATARALIALLGDPDRARAMGEAGRRRAREHYVFDRFRRDLLRGLGLGTGQ